MGKIGIEGLQFYAHHGYYKEEQVLGGKFVVDVYLQTDVSAAANSDQLDQTINYEEVYQLVKTAMEERSKLLEHVAQRILSNIKSRYPQLESVKVRVSKHQPPLKGSVDRVFVELEQ
ncbi:MAG: dihydroneopterin aldolase [Chitinophagales bacterium]